MTQWTERFFPKLDPEERERRLRLFRTVLVVEVGSTLVVVLGCIPDTLGMPRQSLFLIATGLLAILLTVAGYLLARRGTFHFGATLLVLSLLPLHTFFVIFYGTRSSVSILYLQLVLLAAVLLEPRAIFVVTALVSLCYGTVAYLELQQIWPIPSYRPELFSIWHRPSDPSLVQLFYVEAGTVILGYVAVAFFAWVAARSLQQTLSRVRGQASELERYGSELEQMVAARTEELAGAMERLQDSLEVIQEVGSPVLPVFEGVLLAPLIGALDTARAALIEESVLQGIAEHRARVVILDITGVPMVDTAVAKALVQTAQGARLLGATPVLVGIRAEVARTIVELGVDLSKIVTRAGLQEGLLYALETLGMQVVPRGETDTLEATAAVSKKRGER